MKHARASSDSAAGQLCAGSFDLTASQRCCLLCFTTQSSAVPALLQEDELSGVSSALGLCADSETLGCHSLSLTHLLSESKRMWPSHLEHLFGDNSLRSAKGLQCSLDGHSGLATAPCDMTAGVRSAQG